MSRRRLWRWFVCVNSTFHSCAFWRARGRVEAHELLQAGVTQFSRETFSSALDLGRKTLIETGVHPHQAYRAQQHFRRLDMRMLYELMPHRQGDIAQISRIRRRDVSWRRSFSARCCMSSIK